MFLKRPRPHLTLTQNFRIEFCRKNLTMLSGLSVGEEEIKPYPRDAGT